MSNNKSEGGVRKFLKGIFTGIFAVAGALASLASLYNVIKGDTGQLTIILLFGGIAILCAGLVYIRFGKVSSRETSIPRGTQERSRYVYSERARKFALIGTFAVLIFTGTGLAVWQYNKRLPTDKVIILVADFQSLDQQNYGVTENIIEQLREATIQYSDVQVKPLNEVITVKEGREVARMKGKEHKASILLWGWHRTSQVTVHFEVLMDRPRSLTLRQEKVTLNTSTSGLEGFEIQTRLSSEMTYLVLVTIGLARLEAGDLDGAIQLLTMALQQQGVPEQMIDPAIAYFQRGSAYSGKREHDRAIDDYGKAIELRPGDADAYINRGIAYGEKSEYDRAIDDLSKAVELRPDDAGAYIFRGNAYNGKGDYDRAIDDLSKAVELKPDNIDAHMLRGTSYKRKSEYDRAIDDFSKAIELKPDFVVAYILRGNAYKDKGEYDRAMDDLNRAIKLKPDSAVAYTAYINRGNVYSMKGQYDRAINDYSKAIELRPGDADAYINRGAAYGRRNEYDRAMDDLNRAIKLEPGNAEAYNNRGVAYGKRNEHGRAIDDLSKAIELKPDFVDPYVNRGNAYKGKSDYDSAIADYTKAIKLKPDTADAYNNRGNAYAVKGQYNRAIADYDKAIELRPDYADAYNNRRNARQQSARRNDR